MKRSAVVLLCLPLATTFLRAAASDVPILSVCEALRDPERFEGKTVIIVGRFASTSEGSWLSEECSQKFEVAGREFDPMISTAYVVSDFAAAPKLPKGFKWDKNLLREKLEQVRRTTKLSKASGDEWLAMFGRLETKLPHQVNLGNGRTAYSPGFGHLSASPAELISPPDGWHAL